MRHLEDGTIVAIRDGALVEGDAVEHLHACSTCREGLESARGRADAIAELLASLDEPVDLEAARTAVRARLDTRRAADGRPPWHIGRHLGRAAAVLLLAAGAAYALPGSPLRAWLDRDAPAEAGTRPSTAPAPTAQEEPSTGGVEVPLPTGRIRIVLIDVEPGSDIDVVWTEGASARISALPGASYSIGEGRAEVVLGDGPVHMEIPRFAAAFTLEVDGRTYLRREGGGLEVLVPPAEQSSDRIRFIVTER